MTTIGQRFKKIRNELGLSQEAFGEKLKMIKSGISAVENDKVFVSVDVLRSLFLNFNVNLNWFVMGEGEMFNQNAQQYAAVKKDLRSEVLQILKDEGIIK